MTDIGGIPFGDDRSKGMQCARCKEWTGNNTQGHYWGFCKVSKKIEKHHFCCPNNCAIYGSLKTADVAPDAAFKMLAHDHDFTVRSYTSQREKLEDPSRGHTFVVAVWVRGSTNDKVGDHSGPYHDLGDFDEPITVATRAWNLHDALQNLLEVPLDEWRWTDDEDDDRT